MCLVQVSVMKRKVVFVSTVEGQVWCIGKSIDLITAKCQAFFLGPGI